MAGPLEEFRREFRQTTEKGVFFDNASMGPVSPRVTRAVTQCMELRQAMPMEYYRYAAQVFPACKERLAALLGAQPQEIAFTENVVCGINAAAGALPFRAGDNVIFCDREFPSNVYPWLGLEKRAGVEARMVPNQGGTLTVELLDRYADNRTRAVSVSSVQFSDGARADLEALGGWCRDHRAWFIVDCAQSLGVLPLNVDEIKADVVVGLSSKWLLGPFSTGFLYVRRELADQLFPPFLGADSVKLAVDDLDYRLDLKDGAARFEPSLPNAPGIAGLEASLALMEETGFAAIRDQAWQVSGYLIQRLAELEVELAPCALSDRTRSDIVSFRTPRAEEVYRYLRQNRVACSLRCGYIRAGVHGYNTVQEADRFVQVLKERLR